MTNTPAAVCQAATAVARGRRTTDQDIARAMEIFAAVGTVVEVPETMIDAVTALGGSGPAFVYTVIEALAAGGTKCGLSPAVSLGLATQTVRGAAQLALESGLSPEELRRMVITPGGTTAAGLAVMEERRSAEGISAAVTAAAARAKELRPNEFAECSGGRVGRKPTWLVSTRERPRCGRHARRYTNRPAAKAGSRRKPRPIRCRSRRLPRSRSPCSYPG